VQFGLEYGVANTKGMVAAEEVTEILSHALLQGVDLLDTAIGYGESERRLGEAGVAGFKVVTKLPLLPPGIDDVGNWIREQLDASLNRLGLNHVYGLLLHRPDQLFGENGAAIVQALLNLRSEGRVRKIGVSIYNPEELGPISDIMELSLVQAPLNLIDRRLVQTGWLSRLHDSGVEIHVRSAFLQGLLLMPADSIPAGFSPWTHLLETWHAWLQSTSIEPFKACIDYPLSFPEIDRVVVGVDSFLQFRQLIDAAKAPRIHHFPELGCTDERLINPSNWNSL
jgi:aryl-alcohol dehydrogenase-like predicted oxidoreductase